MTETPEFYVDVFQVGSSAWGVAMNFGMSSAKPTLPSQPNPDTPVCVIRMGWECFKMFVYCQVRYIKQIESQVGVKYPVATHILNGMGIAPGDWESFWETPRLPPGFPPPGG